MMQENEDIRKELEQCYIELYRCMTEKDLVSLASILDDNRFVLVHMTGMKQDKQAFIQAIKDGTLNYYSARHENIRTEVNGVHAEAVGESRVTATVFGGSHCQDSVFEKGTDYRSDMPQYTAEGFEKSRELLALLHDMAEEKKATPAQISLAWMLCKKPFIIPIPGSRKPERLKENIGAAGILLTEQEIAAIDGRLNHMELPVFGGHKCVNGAAENKE